jgi:hypothetical protein
MKRFPLYALIWLTLQALPAGAVDSGIYTLVDGDARVLRGVLWHRLVPGAQLLAGDVIDVPDKAQIQVELARGGALSLTGPAGALAVSLPPADAKPGSAVEWFLARGWAKVQAQPKGPPLRLRSSNATVELGDGVAVAEVDAARTRIFIESGIAKVSVPVARGKEAPAREAREGQTWSRVGDRAFTVDEHIDRAFVAAMPRGLRDALPRLAARFQGSAPALAAGPAISFAEAEPWLASRERRSFIRRFTPRLADPLFRDAAASHAAAYPEWGRSLHPEKHFPDAAPAPQS